MTNLHRRSAISWTTIVGLIAAITLTSCADSGKATYQGDAPAAVPLDAAAVSEQTESAIENENILGQQTVAGLRAICSGLGDWQTTPSNWQLVSNLNDGPPYEMALDGDGGALFVLVTPGKPRAAISVSETNYEATNALLYYSGCKTITTEPDIPNEPLVGTTTSVVTIPNFLGNTEEAARRWASGLQINFVIDYGIRDTYGACVTLQIGPVIGQSVPAGTVVENAQSTKIGLRVDCERTHWVGYPSVN